jgi:hypothetical protein
MPAILSSRNQFFSLRADKPVDVVAVIALEICVLTPEKAALGRTAQAQIYCSEGSGHASLAVYLVNKAPKEHLDFRERIIWGRSANIGL